MDVDYDHLFCDLPSQTATAEQLLAPQTKSSLSACLRTPAQQITLQKSQAKPAGRPEGAFVVKLTRCYPV